MIHSLPLNFLKVLESCIPYFCGISHSIYRRLEGNTLKGVCTVFLDFPELPVRVRYPETQTIDRVPLKQQSSVSVSSAVPNNQHVERIPVCIEAVGVFFTEFVQGLVSQPARSEAGEMGGKHAYLLLRSRVLRLLAKLLRESVHCFRRKVPGKDAFESGQFVVRTCNSLLRNCPEGKENAKDVLRFIKDFADTQHFMNWVSTVSEYLDGMDRERAIHPRSAHEAPREVILRQQQLCLFDDLLGAYGWSAADVKLDEESPQLADLVAGESFSLHYFDSVNMTEIEAALGINSSIHGICSSYANVTVKTVDMLPEYLGYTAVHALHTMNRKKWAPEAHGSKGLNENFEKSVYHEAFLQSEVLRSGQKLVRDTCRSTFTIKRSVQMDAIYDLRLFCRIQTSRGLMSYLKVHPYLDELSAQDTESRSDASDGDEFEESSSDDQEPLLFSTII